MGHYKNYADRPRFETHEQCKKIIFYIHIEVDYDFAIDQNLCT